MPVEGHHMKERLSRSDYRFIAICLTLLGCTVWFSARNFYKAFPEASIDFKVNREGARDIAGKFLTSHGYLLSNYRSAAQFDYDDEAKTFLERELGLEQANRLMGSRVRLWRWKYRWFRPLQKEEFRAEITPRGEIAGFEHDLPEEAARPDVTGDQARTLAEAFLRTKVGRDRASLDFVEEADVVRPHRIDRTFTWKERGSEIHDATYRVSVTVLGNEVGDYREFLKVPEQWKRDYERLRSKNELMQKVDFYAMAVLMCGLLTVIVLRVRRDDVRWRWASWVGLAGIILGFLSQVNEFPLHEFSYATTDSYSSFVFRAWLNALLAGLGSGGFLFVLAAGAEPLYREYMADKLSLGALMSVRGLRTKRFFLGTILGITLTGIFIAYQTGFYIVAFRNGAWSPADVPYTDLLNTRFPWAFVLFGGFFPAVFEEFAFRMFAIPFLRKAARSVAVAVVVAGFLWGFGHSSYPQQPFYIRGVEVGIGGVALGIIMLRFGILPTLVWHYSVDAMYSAMLLMRSESLYYKLSGAGAAGIMVLPALMALVAYWRGGGFESEQGLTNRDEGTPEPVVTTQQLEQDTTPRIPYKPLGGAVRIAAVALLVAGLATLSTPLTQFGDKPRYRIGADQARASASGFLLQHGFDPGRFQHVTYPEVHWVHEDRFAAQYFLERRTMAEAASLFEHYRPVQHWMTRYFRPLDEEEVQVSVHPETAQPLGFSHNIPEDRPGADLPIDQARAIAERFAASHGWNVAGMDLKESASEKKKARRDSDFEWEARGADPRNVGETKFRVAVGVSGDRVTATHVYWKTPEKFDRSRERSNVVSIAIAVGHIVVGAGLLVYALWLVIVGTRRGVVRWRTALMVVAPGAALYPVSRLLMLGLRLKDYDTAKPFETFQVETLLDIFTGMMGMALALVLAAALLATFYPRALEELRRVNRRTMGLDAAFAAIAAAGIGLLWRYFEAALTAYFHTEAVLDVSAPDVLASAAPALGAITEAVSSLVIGGAVLGLVAMLIFQVKKRWMIVAGVMVALIAVISTDVRTAGEFALEYGLAVSMAAAGVAFCWFFARRNYLAYALVLWLASLASPVAELMATKNGPMQAQGWTIVLVMAVSVVWAAGPAMWKRKAPEL
jgi:membrane protease YdiL (CAAX protease family)